MAQATAAPRGIMTEEEREITKNDVFWHSQLQGLYGAVLTASICAISHVGLEKYVPLYQAANWRFKLFTTCSLTVGAYCVQAENSHLEKMTIIADDNALRRQAVDDAVFKARKAALK